MATSIESGVYYTLLSYFPVEYARKDLGRTKPSPALIRSAIHPWVYNTMSFIQRDFRSEDKLYTLTLEGLKTYLRFHVRNDGGLIVADFTISPAGLSDSMTSAAIIEQRENHASNTEIIAVGLLRELAAKLPKRT